MLEQPRIYVSKIPEGDTTRIPADAIDLTSGAMGYMVNDNIDGLARPDADISISALAGANASRIGRRQITERNIVMDIIPLPDFRINRERLYHILPFEETRRIYVETKDRCVFIDGEIEKLNGPFKPDKPFSFGVSIICPFPWFHSVKLHKLNLHVGDNVIRYDGDVPDGFTLDVPQQITPPLIGSVSDLSVSVGGKTFAYSGRIAVPHICTIPGKKQFYGIRKDAGNTLAPAFGAMVSGCQWPTISKSDKIVTISCAEADVEWFEQQNVFTYRDTYSGV